MELKDFLNYSAETGLFTWKVRTSNRVKVGDIAGVKNKLGYIVIAVNKQKYYAHRLAVFFETGEWPSDCVDHINGVKHDNRIENLRCVTKAGNNLNKHKATNGLGVLGVNEYMTKNGIKYRAVAQINGKYKHIGSFDTIDEASAAYKAFKAEEIKKAVE